jgi:hypothetical protein
MLVGTHEKNEFFGVGGLVQLLGLAAPLALGAFAGLDGIVLGIVILLACLIVGHRMSKSLLCGGCGNRVDPEARECPTCHARFGA